MKVQAPTTSFMMKLNTLKKSCSKTELLVADYIAQHPETVIHLSVSGLAERCGASESTVIRTCRKLGETGYQDLKVTLAQSMVTPLKAINEEIQPDDTDSAVIAKVFRSAEQTLEATHGNLKPETMVEASEALIRAKKVAICGLGNSYVVALDLQHKLLQAGIEAAAYTDPHLQIISAARLTPGDALFAVSHTGSSKNIVELARMAKRQGVTVISLTNTGRSPLYDLADIRLCTISPETQFSVLALSSRAAQLVIVNALYTLIRLKKDDASRDYQRIEKALANTKY